MSLLGAILYELHDLPQVETTTTTTAAATTTTIMPYYNTTNAHVPPDKVLL